MFIYVHVSVILLGSLMDLLRDFALEELCQLTGYKIMKHPCTWERVWPVFIAEKIAKSPPVDQ